ncbi:hemagglutinin repeat-containing protein [Cupriavidus oxalaticus]|uniref:hemagglutinin repeat-containing protein n=1 Tax=Cupriavidus oxalaticus TaxID=96344 RepID=UPI00317632E7
MNKNLYRLVFNPARGMLLAVQESAIGRGKGWRGGGGLPAARAMVARFAVPALTLGVSMALGVPMVSTAQVVADPNAGGNRPTVVQTANGIQQVNITRPSAAGVSTNGYTQFDVPKAGVILNNSPTITNTQQAGYVNGNPNLLPGGSARIIVNQVNSPTASPSQLRGHIEVAGPGAQVVVANPNGLLVDGLGFINTTRATLTTGAPVYGGSGSLDAYRVTGGQINVQGDGLNAANVDQVDLIARAVQANAALYGNQLNVVAGANRVDHNTLAATPIASSGAAPTLGIDVSQLGGMYANKILLASTEHGVGVSLRGVQAAQAGDLTLTAQGKLILTGQTNASGNIVAYARDGIDNSGTTYAKGAASINTDGTLANSGTLAAQQWINAYGGAVSSTGTLAAGLNEDGSTASPADLAVVATGGAVSATGRNIASGNATIQGTGVNLAGSTTSAGGNLNLAASAGNVNLTGATTTAGAGLVGSAAGAIVNDRGNLSSGAATTLIAASLSNQGGQMVSQGATTLQATGAIHNAQGVVQASGALNASGASLDNTAGRMTSLNGDGLTIQTSGAFVNAAGTTASGAEGGVIGGNGNVQLTAGAMTNHGKISAQGDTSVTAAALDNDTGSVTASGALTATVAGALSNRQGMVSGGNTSVSAQSLDNSAGSVQGDQVAIRTTGDLINRGGAIRQFGESDTTITAGGTLDNTAGNITANGQSLTVQAGTLVNDSGSISHAGTGTLAVNSQGEASNAGGTIQTNGDLQAQAVTLNNAEGVLSAQRLATIQATGDLLNRQGALYGKTGLTVNSGGNLDNTAGSAQTGGDLSVTAAGSLTNVDGTIAANGEHGQATVSAASVDNTRGDIANAGDGATAMTATTAMNNTAGTLGGNGDLTVSTQTLTNTSDGTSGGFVASGGALNLNVTHQVDNRQGTLYGGRGLTLDQANTTLVNDGGQVLGKTDVNLHVASLSNAGGAVKANQDIAVQGAVSGSGTMTAGRNLALDVAGDYTNDANNHLHADGDMRVAATGTLTNTATLAAVGALTATGARVMNAAGATINSTNTTVTATELIDNAGRIEGDTVETDSATLNNTGTVIGNNVTVKATDITNNGAAALMAAAQNLNVHATNSVRNLDGATLYSAGNLQIARDGTRDAATGLLANQVTTLINRSATIEAEGDIDIAANQVSNTRTSIVADAGTPVTGPSQTLTMWNAGMSGVDLNFHESVTFPSWRWDGTNASVSASRTLALTQPITVTVDKSTVTNFDAAAKTLCFTQAPVEQYYTLLNAPNCDATGLCTRTLTTNAMQYYQSITDNGSTYSITFWPDFDPAIHIRPDQVKLRYDLGTDSHDYSEISRTTTTTTATDRLVSATDPAKLQAGGSIRINSAGGSILNQSSTMAAGGDLTRVAPNGGVQDLGTALQASVSTTDTSTFYWHQKIGSSSDTQVVVNPSTPQAPTTVMALPAVASANQAVQTTAQTISVATVNREGETVTGSGNDLSGGGATGAQVAGAAGGPAKAPQTLGTASGGIPNLTLPTNGLYSYRTAPGSTYLIATDPRFTQYGKFISSDYLLGQLGLDPAMTQKRLGDGWYEQKLVRDQVTQLTGRTYLTGYSDQLAEYQALMDAGVMYARLFQLAPGIGLSEAQMAQLTTDMVWLVSQDVTLPDGSHQTVLVPKLYLAQANSVDLQHTGALVTGSRVSLDATGDIANSGRIVGDLATQVVGSNIENRGQIGGTGTTVVKAQQDVRNLGGRITGTDTLVSAGRDVINETQTVSNQVTMGNHSAGATGIGAVAAITATNNVGVLAGRDINMAGGVVGAGNNALLGAGRDVNLGTLTTGTTQDSSSRGGQSYYHDQTTVNVSSSVQAGKNAVAVAGRDVTLTGSAIDAGSNASLAAGRNTTVTAAIDTHTHSEGSLGGKGAQYTKSSYDETVSGSAVSAGNNANLAAGQLTTVNSVLQANGITASTEGNGTGNLAVLGSSVITDKGAANLIATGDVTVGTVNEKHTAESWSESRHSSGLAREQTTKSSSQAQDIAVGSMVSADSVNGRARRDLTVTGSSIGATGDVSLHADRNLTIGASEGTASSSSSQETRKSGLLSGGGASFTVGKQQTDQNETVQSTTHTGSLVGSVGGNVDLSAGQAYTQTGSVVTALQGDVSIQAKSVDINAATDTYRMDQETHFKQSGLTVAVSNPLIAAAQTVGQMAEAQGRTDDPRMKALAGAAGGLAAKNAYDAVKGDPASAGGINISVTVGGSRSDSQQTQTATTAVGSKVSAGGTVSIRAEGAGQDSNINVVGSDIQAGNDLRMKADNQVNLQAAASTAEQHSSSQSVSGGVGIGINVSAKGTSFGVTANAVASRGNADGDDVTWTNSHATAGNTLVIDSGGDTNLKGAVASGKQVVANVGGDLNIESLQDTSTYRSKDQSIGGSVTVGAGFSGSANVGQQKINSDFASVGEQSAIRAGAGGYQIDVKGNTDLKGAVIAGGTQDRNSLITDSLTVSDIQNHAEYSGSSVSIGAGFTAGGSGGKSTVDGGGVGLTQGGQATTGGDAVPGTTLPTTGDNGQGFSFAPPMVAGASGSADSTTASGVSAGTITIRNDAKQKELTGKDGAETIADLNRDTANTGNSLAPIFNEQEIKAGFEIVGALQREAGVFLNNRAAEADAAKQAADAAANDPTATLEQRTALQQQSDDLAKWGQGGIYRQVMTVLTAAASGNVTGSTAQFVQSAAVGYLQGLAANQVKQLISTLELDQTPQGEAARAALHAIVGCAGAAAASQACGAGAMGAASASVMGSLLAPTTGMTPEQKQARESMVQSLVAGIAGTTGMNAATATNAATFEIENNQAASLSAPRPMPTPGTPLKPFQTPGKPADPAEAALTGTPDQSGQNEFRPLKNPVQTIVGTVLVTPGQIVEGLGAILNSGDQRTSKTPNTGDPGSWVTNPGSGQQRQYGPDGKPLVDIDVDHDHGQGTPHVHNWDRAEDGRPVRGQGLPVSPISRTKP